MDREELEKKTFENLKENPSVLFQEGLRRSIFGYSTGCFITLVVVVLILFLLFR